MKIKQVAINGSILLVSIAVAILLCEAGLRNFLNLADYMPPRVTSDNILGMAVAPGIAGFDEWGFRNRAVPSRANVVAIGDSHTYGNTATMDDSWPSVLARTSGLEVYNMGLGGYGPNQYHYLLTTKALRLHPDWVVCGLYMGDDFENAFSITHGLEYWRALRNEGWDDVNADIWGVHEDPVWAAGFRNWLSENSIVYRIIFHGPLLENVKQRFQFGQLANNSDPYTTTLVVDDKNIREAFRPIAMATRIDQTSGQIREGMRITFELLKKMDRACREVGCRFLVVIIPTKETVFSDYLEKNSELHLHQAFDRLITNERMARATLIEFLDRNGIPYTDTLPALKQSVGGQLYARTTRDMHPSRNGYRVIGEVVANYLERSGANASGVQQKSE